MPNTIPTIAWRRATRLAARGLLVASLAAALGACKTTARDNTGSIPQDYRDRHPIAIKEGDRKLTLFVGAGRGGLTPMQRAEVLAFAQTWKREATGGIIIDRPVGTPNERAAQDNLETRPFDSGERRHPEPRHRHQSLHARRRGLWPDDLGPSYDPKHFDNEPFFNLGCATQRNLAAMVENPADFVQPRGETPAYAAKRATGMDKWRKGEGPATTYPEANKGAISDLGK